MLRPEAPAGLGVAGRVWWRAAAGSPAAGWWAALDWQAAARAAVLADAFAASAGGEIGPLIALAAELDAIEEHLGLVGSVAATLEALSN